MSRASPTAVRSSLERLHDPRPASRDEEPNRVRADVDHSDTHRRRSILTADRSTIGDAVKLRLATAGALGPRPRCASAAPVRVPRDRPSSAERDPRCRRRSAPTSSCCPRAARRTSRSPAAARASPPRARRPRARLSRLRGIRSALPMKQDVSSPASKTKSGCARGSDRARCGRGCSRSGPARPGRSEQMRSSDDVDLARLPAEAS